MTTQRYFLQPSQDEGWLVATDAEFGIVIKFKEHQFNETQIVTMLEDSVFRSTSPAKAAQMLATVMKELGDWLSANHYSSLF